MDASFLEQCRHSGSARREVSLWAPTPSSPYSLRSSICSSLPKSWPDKLSHKAVRLKLGFPFSSRYVKSKNSYALQGPNMFPRFSMSSLMPCTRSFLSKLLFGQIPSFAVPHTVIWSCSRIHSVSCRYLAVLQSSQRLLPLSGRFHAS